MRGFAIALMLVDHLLSVLDAPVTTRLGPTRLSLPIFMVLSGWLRGSRAPMLRRYPLLMLAAASSAVASQVAGLGQPDILGVYLIALVAFDVLRWAGARPVWIAALSMAVGAYLWLPWDGYQPTTVLAMFSLGAACSSLPIWPQGLPAPRVLQWLGARPLQVFVAQAWAFATLALVLR